MKSVTVILSLVIINACSCSDLRSDSDVLRSNLLKIEHQIWTDILPPYTNVIVNDSDTTAVRLMHLFAKFDHKLQKQFPNTLYSGPLPLETSWIWARTKSELLKANTLYEAFRRFQMKQVIPDLLPSPKQAWIDVAENILFGTNNIPKFSDTLEGIILKDDIFGTVLREINSDLCNLHQSPNQLLYNLYNSIALTELKGYAMMQFSYMLLKLFEKGNFTHEAEIMRQRYKGRTSQTIAAVKRAMSGSSQDLWICDARIPKEGETFVRLTELLQGYVENEVDMNSEATCRENCAAYQYTNNYGCFKEQYCAKQKRCNGKIIGCQYIDSDMWICPANKDSGRRYEYIEYENGRVLGRKTNCPRGTTKVDSWWRWVFWHCSYCFCFCDELGNTSDRFFNLRDVVADVKNNRVVTGLRFVKVNRIIHLQIQQGGLRPRANIDPSTQEWVPVDDYHITDTDVSSGKDFHTMTWDNRAIDLDDLQVPNGHVMTGVRFRKVGKHLNFEIQYCLFNFSEGKLIDPTNRFHWISNDNTDGSDDKPRVQLTLERPDVPTRSQSPSAPDSQSNQYIHFTHSDIDRDAAQTTIPFLDAQDVVPEIAVPLVGAGIYHKGQLGFGGYIASKVMTFDYSPYLDSSFLYDN